MKFYTIALMVFLLNISAAVINVAGLFTGYSIQPQQSWIDEASATATQNEEYFQNIAAQDVSENLGFGDFLKGLALFIRQFAKGVIAPYYLLKQFGMPTRIAIPISSSVYIIYFFAIAQFIANRGAKSME